MGYVSGTATCSNQGVALRLEMEPAGRSAGESLRERLKLRSVASLPIGLYRR